MPPEISIVIPTYNRLGRLRRVLTALGRQTLSCTDFEVIVVSDGSTDGTDDFLESAQFPFCLRFSSQTNAGPAVARNRGVSMARGNLLVFIDDDVVAHPDLVQQHRKAHEGGTDRLVVVGPMLTPPDHRQSPFVRWEQAMLCKQYEAMNRGVYQATHRQFYTGNASVSREFFLSVGGFDERYRRAEDVELAHRMHRNGAQFVFNRFAIGQHYAERSFRAWVGIASEYGRNEVRFDRAADDVVHLYRVREEFFQRNKALQWLTRAFVGNRWLEWSLPAPTRILAVALDTLRLRRLCRLVLSGLYNVTFYAGLADELGGAREFWRIIDGEGKIELARTATR